jgi:hypothetical protein
MDARLHTSCPVSYPFCVLSVLCPIRPVSYPSYPSYPSYQSYPSYLSYPSYPSYPSYLSYHFEITIGRAGRHPDGWSSHQTFGQTWRGISHSSSNFSSFSQQSLRQKQGFCKVDID